MALRWIYKAWSVFWTIISITLAVAVFLSAIGFGVLQLPVTKNYIANSIEDRFNSQHNGFLKIGSITGTLPINVQIQHVNLYADSNDTEAVFTAEKISASFDIPSLLRNRFLITGMDLSSPEMIIDPLSEHSVLYAVQRKKDFRKAQSPDSLRFNNEAPFVEILAPSVLMNNGRFIIHNAVNEKSPLYIADSLTLDNLNFEMYLQYSLEQRYLDIENLSMNIPELGEAPATMFGQIFNDQRFLEFNAFNLNVGKSSISFSGEADGVDLLKGDIASQLVNSEFTIRLNQFTTFPKQIRKIVPAFPDSEQPVSIAFQAKGTIDSLWFEDYKIGIGESEISGYGSILNPLNESQLVYNTDITGIVFDSTELRMLLPELTNKQIGEIQNSSLEAKVRGNTSSLSGNADLISNRGNINLEGSTQFSSNPQFNIDLSFESLDIGEIITSQISKSNLNGTAQFKTSDLQLISAIGKADIQLLDSSIDELAIDSLSAESEWKSGIFTPSFRLISPGSNFNGMGTVDFRDSIPAVEFSGSGNDLELKKLIGYERMSEVLADIEYELFLEGSSRENLFGQISIDIPNATIGQDTIRAHQFYADFTEPDENTRTLRVTSTAFDFLANGNFDPNSALPLYNYWNSYFRERIYDEILFRETEKTKVSLTDTLDQNLNMSLSVKDLGILKAYLPELPEVHSGLNINSEVNANSNRLLFNATVRDRKFAYKDYEVDSLTLQVTGSFRHADKLKTFSGIQLAGQGSSLKSDVLSGDRFSFNFDMDEDSVHFEHNIQGLGEGEANLSTSLNLLLSDSSIIAEVKNFELGSELYNWRNQGIPKLIYTDDEKLVFEQFSFSNFDEFISLEGVFSSDTEDSVNYVINSVNLSRISNLIDGRIDFSGDLNGNFTTRSLTRIPTIQGAVSVDGLAIENSVVGDIDVSSSFNQQLNRFDTKIVIKTDSTKYPEYFNRNNRDGQDIFLDGYVLAPEEGQFPDVDSLFKFQLDFESVDLWIIPFIAPNVFEEMSGKASGHGFVWGNLDDFDFSVDYNVGVNDAVYMKPRFLETFYYAQGPVTFNRTDGLVFKDLFVIDPSGGSAVLSGTYDLGDFQPLHYIDLRLEMDEFQFLNNEFDQTVPFFGKAYGSSTVTLTGTNIDPVLATETPVYISAFSDIGIPLLEETEFNQDNKFIRFVDNFSEYKGLNPSEITGISPSAQEIQENPTELTFTERFTLDLQFIANEPMTVQLIFDPVTGDLIKADGTGRLRIRLQDEELTMFGQFDISSGYYNFVSGDIFSRRFQLESGGTIIWEGSPTDARINMSAVYEARPDINTLTQARSEIDRENSQRVPVQLVLNVGGSLTSIENEFFFRLPNTFESRQNSTLSTQINALNRNEDEKLIQATSFLLMGDFIPSATAGTGATNSFTNNLSGSAAVLNPLLSSQVISPLLSNQINSLLRSDIGSLDIDFNLNTYNNVDLGVALRLYNDRIILSREGQITGTQSDIGDLGATYRINQIFSVTAFHRQDPTFSSFAGEETQQAQDINGVGFEAEVSFNSWREFFRKITSPFRKLFGKKESEEGNGDSEQDGVASTIN